MNWEEMDEDDKRFYLHCGHEAPAEFVAVRLGHHMNVPWQNVDMLASALRMREQRFTHATPQEILDAAGDAELAAKAILVACQSPIEQLFVATLCMQHPFRCGKHLLNLALHERWEPAIFQWVSYDESGFRTSLATIYQQFPVAGFKVDFAIETPKARIAIELDGHDFHERTKQQAARDKSRDRAITEAGWPVLRFTGSEIWKDPSECVQQAIRVAGASDR